MHFEEPQDFRKSDVQPRASDVEITQLLQEASQQYEECMRIANLADFSEPSEFIQPSYIWDAPIGLVITG